MGHIPGLIALFTAIAAPAFAQEAIWTPSATQPAKGLFTLRTQTRVLRLSDDPTGLDREATVLTQDSVLSYGLSRNLSVSLGVPLTIRQERRPDESDRDAGLGDFVISAKYRLWQSDSSAIDFSRFAVLGGAELPTGSGDLSSHSFDPYLGAVFTAVRGRHGLNQSIRYTFNTGTDETPLMPGQGQDDALYLDSAYLYRFSPEAYASDTHASFYGVLELNGLYETGGDWEILLSPGVLYEARRFAVELGVQVPTLQEVENRPEVEWGLVFGLRFLF